MEKAVVVKNTGEKTGKMDQEKTKTYLKNVVENALNNAQECIGSLYSTLNDIFDGKGKDTGGKMFQGNRVLHASAGKNISKKSITTFFYEDSDTAYIIAIGQHIDDTSYKLNVYGQNNDNVFKKGSTIKLG